MYRPVTQRAFTLIELLIVVAIIAILAAIAVPNFLEAQTRAKVSRVRADMRSIATALEAYAVDHNVYINDVHNGFPWYITNQLTTPISYISTLEITQDLFRKDELLSSVGKAYRFINIKASEDVWPGLGPAFAGFRPLPGGATPGSAALANIVAIFRDNFGEWRMSSAGPDKTASVVTGADYFAAILLYDPTNGTTSNGDMVRSQANSQELQQH